MSKKEFATLFDTPDYIQTARETEDFLDFIKEKMKQDFDKDHPKASEIEMHSLESHMENLQMLDIVKTWMMQINLQLDQISERQAEIYAMISADKITDSM